MKNKTERTIHNTQQEHITRKTQTKQQRKHIHLSLYMYRCGNNTTWKGTDTRNHTK